MVPTMFLFSVICQMGQIPQLSPKNDFKDLRVQFNFFQSSKRAFDAHLPQLLKKAKKQHALWDWASLQLWCLWRALNTSAGAHPNPLQGIHTGGGLGRGKSISSDLCFGFLAPEEAWPVSRLMTLWWHLHLQMMSCFLAPLDHELAPRAADCVTELPTGQDQLKWPKVAAVVHGL